ncbi:MlaD family protein [Nocardia stercoris]|uniref:MCE family protein n=1 Tax=Nocardia stercoris TaxID=2483361 RepID=A0A3M2LDE8_9NOCA|nr:MlaD family protein [Nocardia stercoris]RMI32718.1 MCE family protein [Nocardia stercoris]
MLRTLLGSRAFMSIAGVVVLAAVVVAGYFVAFDPMKETRSYCAIMPDSVGLYVGNQVTMRGIPVGTVTGIGSQGSGVRVDFSVDATHPVFADAGATTLSNSLVSARQLAVVASGNDRTPWDSGKCLTKTVTPKSLTQTLNALAQLSAELQGPDPNSTDALADGLGALNNATTGTGPEINRIVQQLGSALSTPDADVAHLAGIFDAFASVAQRVQAHWGDLQSMLTRLAPTLSQATDDLLVPGAKLMDGLAQVLPMLNDLTTLFGDPILRALNSTAPLSKLLGSQVGSLSRIVTQIPVLTQAMATTQAHGLDYTPPQVAIAAQNADQVCAVVNAVAQGRCAADGGRVLVDGSTLVFGAAR